MELTTKGAPLPELIEAVGYASDDPFFKKEKFRRCLIDYRKYGIRPPKPVFDSVDKELYYIHLRRKKGVI